MTTIPVTMSLTSFARIDVDGVECRGTAAVERRGMVEVVPCVLLLRRGDDGELRVESVTLNPGVS